MAPPETESGAMLADPIPLTQLASERALAYGEEARTIARLLAASVRAFEGVVVFLRLDDAKPLEAACRAAFAPGVVVAVRPLHATSASARAFAEVVTVPLEVRDESDLGRVASAFQAAATDATLRSAIGGNRTVPVRVIPFDEGSLGLATSVDPVDGSPDRVGVRRGDFAAYRVERRSGRIEFDGEGLAPSAVEDAADLVDRCQMALGRPVEVEWATLAGKLRIVSVASLRVTFGYAAAPLRRVALVAADEGTVAPLAIDALDRGLARSGDRVEGSVASRVYARPYRRLDVEGRLLGAPMGSVPAATSAAAKVAYDAAIAFHADSEFARSCEERFARLAFVDLDELDDDALLKELDERHGLAAETFHRLDRCRELTRRGIVALEVAVGPLPREVYPALSAPKHGRERARLSAELAELARRLGGELGQPHVRDRLDPALARRWDELRRAHVDTRPLGIDVVQPGIGSSDEALRAALEASTLRRRVDALEEARSGALRRVLSMAQERPLGAARAGVVSSVGLVLDRIVTSKGRLAEVLARALGHLRSVALECGGRLVDRAILDARDDAFYLVQRELELAMRGEPSGLAARVRSRREDDARWARFDAPRRLREEVR